MIRRNLSGFGRMPGIQCQVASWSEGHWDRWLVNGGIARGLGRAYGDSACSGSLTVETASLNRILHFDIDQGILIAEGGLSLFDLLQAIIPKGWFVPVTPGTQYVTLAGMVAADVHGKNHHHVGSISNFIDWIEIQGPSGTEERISRDRDPEWFAWTCGGMGLTGLILRVQIRLTALPSPWIQQSTVVTANLESTMQCFEAHSDAAFSVAWLDASSCGAALGRSVVLIGEHRKEVATAENDWLLQRDKQYTVPSMPICLINRWSTDLFNSLYYRKQRNRTQTVHWCKYFYPLDGLRYWNRVYGRNGFAQFQTVLPFESASSCIPVLLNVVRDHGFASPISVLKKMGAEAPGFSFPMPGYTLTLDLPNVPGLASLMTQLIDIATDSGGRFYLAKDAHLTANQLKRADPRVEAFREFRAVRGMDTAFVSEQSKRLRI